MTPVVLGIDLATSAARVVAVDAVHGRPLGFVGAPLPSPRSDHPGDSRQDAEYLTVVRTLLGRTVGLLGDRARDVIALTVTGTSGSLVPCDRSGVPLGEAVLYDDVSARPDADRLAGQGFRTGPGSVPARMGLLVREGRRADRAAPALLLHTPDVVLAGLAGRVLPTDTSHALKAGIDPVQRCWPLEMLAAVEVDVTLLPELVAPGVEIGVMADDVADELGLPRGIRLISGMTDGCTAQIACGAVAPGDTVGVLGTTLVLKGVSVERIDDGVVYSHLGPDGSWWPGAASNVGAGVLAGSVRQKSLPALDAAAAAAGPSTVLRYPLRGTGERFPIADPAFTGWEVGTPRDAVEAHRAALEGVAFTERYGLERLAALGLRRGTHRLAGGATRSEVWNRIRATVLHVPVLVCAAAGSGHGAAALAASGVSGESLATIVHRWAPTLPVVDPDPAETDRLEASFLRWSAELARRAAPAPT